MLIKDVKQHLLCKRSQSKGSRWDSVLYSTTPVTQIRSHFTLKLLLRSQTIFFLTTNCFVCEGGV